MKKAQIQLGETIFVVIIIVVIIVFGIVFYAQTQERESGRQQDFLQELDAIAMNKYITQLTEIQCSLLQVQQNNCLDIHKLEALQQFALHNPSDYSQYYFTQLSDAKLWVVEIYPPTNTTWVLYNNTLGNVTPRRSTLSFVPVSLRNSISSEQSFGLIYLETYYR